MKNLKKSLFLLAFILLGTISIKIIEKDDSAFIKVMNNLFSKGG